MGRLTPSFRQLYEETISELKIELQADLGHKSAFDMLLKEAWNPEQAFWATPLYLQYVTN
jgi:hypothetical protein